MAQRKVMPSCKPAFIITILWAMSSSPISRIYNLQSHGTISMERQLKLNLFNGKFIIESAICKFEIRKVSFQ